MKDLKTETLLVHAGRHRNPDWDYVNPPVVRASTVLHRSSKDMLDRVFYKGNYMDGKPCYGTFASPVHKAFYEALMALEGPKAAGAWAFPTGLAACTVPLLAFLRTGAHALFADSIYGPTRDFALGTLRRMGVEIEFYDPGIGGNIRKLFRENTALVMMETPGSHSFELMDVPAVAQACRERGIASVIDNTWATPLYFKPLEAGVDMVIHAATKYIAGHSDLTMGVVICSERVWPDVYRTSTELGQTASGDDVWLAYRGLHTMAVRVKRASESAAAVIDWLKKRPEVERVLWPALPEDPSYPIWKRDFTGATSLFAVMFRPEYAGRLAPFVDALTLFGRGYSWGGYESLLIPSYGTRTVKAVPFERMVRIAVGLEAPEDLIRDLEAGFAALR
ncbi:MAG: cystathionine beta-lyase [Sutterella sp.]|nr:cystathionine beta-lyase [Sutterella sp.]